MKRIKVKFRSSKVFVTLVTKASLSNLSWRIIVEGNVLMVRYCS